MLNARRLNARRIGLFFLLCFLPGLAAYPQTKAELHTSETQLEFEASANSPRVSAFSVPGQDKWNNRSSETLIPFVEVSGSQIPCAWSFNAEASHAGEQGVTFVYESAFPHLRLTWEWRVRQNYGPIEHQIRIENLSDQELWIPMQDSLAFDWQVNPQAALQHSFVEKGANTPSAGGTHENPVGEGYRWTGTASTYGDLSDREPREIIPWSLIQRSDAPRSGWYAGIESSARTRISLDREKDSLKVSIGLNPDPAPFRTQLEPREVFESPVVFFGGFRDGPDGAGNVIRRWVRAVLGNPETWKNPNYPLWSTTVGAAAWM
jgi:hypothetical protein